MDQNQIMIAVIYHITRNVAQCGSNFMTIFDFFISGWKNWPFLRGYFCSWGHALVVKLIAAVARWPLQRGLTRIKLWTVRCDKKSDWWQEVAVSGGSTVLVLTTNWSHCFPIVIELTVAKPIKSNMCGENTKWWSINNPEGNGCLLSPVME